MGLKIESLKDRTDIMFSSDVIGKYPFQNINFNGTFGMVTSEENKTTLFLGTGKFIEKDGFSIQILGEKSGAATLVYGNNMQLTCDDVMLLTIPDTYKKGEVVLTFGFKQLRGERLKMNGKNVVNFKVPAMNFQEIAIGLK
ncbi:hypothetical protein V6246_12785 [Algibacter sp. TI.3.09]|uniref:hypothetical protein n=1 Tax=Algibacter sp. TI.3.09 TaxID=3121298 RepID=UPI00311E274E